MSAVKIPTEQNDNDKFELMAEAIALSQVMNIKGCVACGSNEKILCFNVVTGNIDKAGLLGFAVCRSCMEKPLKEIIDHLAAMKVAQGKGSALN